MNYRHPRATCGLEPKARVKAASPASGIQGTSAAGSLYLGYTLDGYAESCVGSPAALRLKGLRLPRMTNWRVRELAKACCGAWLATDGGRA